MRRSSIIEAVAVVACVGGCGLPGGGLLGGDDGGSPQGDATMSGGDSSEEGSSVREASPLPDVVDGAVDGPELDAIGARDAVPDAQPPTLDAADAGAVPASPCPSPVATACLDPLTGGSDFCSNGRACTSCVDGRDDSSCTIAYGSSVASFLCLSGLCVRGDCRTSGDCAQRPKGSICGAAVPHLCGRCTTDAQCAAAFPASSTGASICNPTTGQCVDGACPSALQNPPLPCPVSATDVCCAGQCQAGGSKSCCPGPDANTYCAGVLQQAKAACANGVCSVCPPASGGTYIVSPAFGSDQTGTGAGAPGCALRTITAALRLVANPPAATTIVLVGPSTVGPAESFPIALPANVRLTTSSGAVTIQVPAGVRGFTLASPSSGLAGAPNAPLTLDGGMVATNGIVVDTGSQPTTRIMDVTVTGFVSSGLLVEGAGILSIGPGVTSSSNGASMSIGSGLHVTADGHAEVIVAAGDRATHFDSNANHGIFVDGNASVTVSGVVASATMGTGTVTVNNNTEAGLWVSQTSPSPPPNVITGLVSFGSSHNGMRLWAGSNVRLRDSVSLGNTLAGLVVSESNSSDLSLLDLGNAMGPDYGRNVFQASGAAQNRGAGLCLQVMSGEVLNAAGNVFRSARCDTASAPLTLNDGACGGACGAAPCDLGISPSGGGDIDVSMCTHP